MNEALRDSDQAWRVHMLATLVMPLRPTNHSSADILRGMNQHRFVWHDLNTTDITSAKRFYGEVFNWNFSGDGEYEHIKAGDQMTGGIRKLGAN